MNDQEILNLKKCIVANDATRNVIHINVFYVARACFNDEMLVESMELKVDEIKDKDLYWFDLYLGRKADNKIKAAIACIERFHIYFLFDDGESIKVVKNNYTVLNSDNFNDSYLIATHVR